MCRGKRTSLSCVFVSPDQRLLLRHAFEDQDAIRVAMKADLRNIRSQRAIEALGAVREGVWRNHRVLSTGRYRDTVYYSVIDSEWLTVKGLTEERLKRKARPSRDYI